MSNRINPNLVPVGTLTPDLINKLQPQELTRYFFHAVRVGQVDRADYLLQYNSSLINELDEGMNSALHLAVKDNQMPMLQFLISKGANVNKRGGQGTRPLHLAATLRSSEAISELLNVPKIKVDAVDDKGQTALHIACRRNHSESVKILLEHRARLQFREIDCSSVLHQPAKRNNMKLCELLTADTGLLSLVDKYGVTPLMTASAEGSIDLLEYFLKAYAQAGGVSQEAVNFKDKEGNAALHYAVKNNRVAIVQALVSYKAGIDVKNLEGSTPLHTAATLGHVEAVQELMQLGASLSVSDVKLRTPLHNAIIAKQEATANLMLKFNAPVSSVDHEFMTPFTWACRRGLTAIVSQLIALDQRLLLHTDIDRKSGLHWAVRGNYQETSKTLLAADACKEIINLSDNRDNTPLHHAVEHGDVDLLMLLVNSSADLHIVDSSGRTATQIAVHNGDINLLKSILSISPEQKRTTLRHRDATGMTSLLIAASQGHAELFQLLVDEGADFTAKDDSGRNALMLCCLSGHSDIAAIILDKGIDVNLSDMNKNTALHYACKHRNDTKCLELLLENGANLQENHNKQTPIDIAVFISNELALDVLFSDEHYQWVMKFRRHNGHNHMNILIEHSPDTAMKLLDRSVTESSADYLDENFAVTYNFELISPGPDDPASQKILYFALKPMAQHKRESLLQHPLCKAVLKYKWSVARYFFSVDLFFYFVFLACITAFIADNRPLPSSQIDQSTGCKNTTSSGTATGERQQLTSASLLMEKYVTVVLLSVRLLIEFFKLLFKRQHYLKNYENYFFLVMYGLSFAFMYPPNSEPCRWNWICGVYAIILAWGLLIFQFEHLPITGIYSLMFQKVIVSLVKVILVFLFFIVGFGLALYIGFSDSTPFSLPTYAILKAFDMTIGELDFVTYFHADNGVYMQTAMFFVFIIFVVIMPFALMNLLVGIAVGDIDGISKEAELRRLDIRISLIYELETNMPSFVQRMMNQRHMQVYPNKTGSWLRELLQPYGKNYREWQRERTSSSAETTQGERLESVEDLVRQLAARVETIHKLVDKPRAD